jgi:hypothetical protein
LKRQFLPYLPPKILRSRRENTQFDGFTPLESPGIYAGDVINRKHPLLVKAGSKPHLSNGVYFLFIIAQECCYEAKEISSYGGTNYAHSRPADLLQV